MEERRAVSQALLALNHFPAGMELFPASNDDQWTLIRGVIDDSDYYIIIIGGRYGSVTEEGISFTEKEFDYAVSSGKPILAFVHSNPDSIASGRTDQNDAARAKLEKLREKVLTGRMAKFWNSPETLGLAVTQAVSAETKRHPGEGWVRGNLSGDPVRLNELNSQIEELKRALEKARTLPPPGAEQYAQGDEEFEINYTYRRTYLASETPASIVLTWNNIFYEIGPIIMDESAEGRIRRRLAEELPNYDEAIDFKPERIEIENDDFETVKIQLIALGLMKKSEKKHVPSDSNVYWQITPYGEHLLTRLRAIKKGKRHPPLRDEARG